MQAVQHSWHIIALTGWPAAWTILRSQRCLEAWWAETTTFSRAALSARLPHCTSRHHHLGLCLVTSYKINPELKTVLAIPRRSPAVTISISSTPCPLRSCRPNRPSLQMATKNTIPQCRIPICSTISPCPTTSPNPPSIAALPDDNPTRFELNRRHSILLSMRASQISKLLAPSFKEEGPPNGQNLHCSAVDSPPSFPFPLCLPPKRPSCVMRRTIGLPPLSHILPRISSSKSSSATTLGPTIGLLDPSQLTWPWHASSYSTITGEYRKACV